MEAFYLILGLFLIIAGIMDFIWTTLWVDGAAGPITNRSSTWLWRFLKKISIGKPKLLSLSGPIILSFTLLTWIVLLWIGWTFVFAGNANSLINSQTFEPITWIERIYYVGYLIFTLGNGDISPLTGFSQIATVAATGTGMLFITLGVTYLLSILGAVTQKRALAESIYGIGKTSEDLVISSWNSQDFHDIDLLLNSFSAELSAITAQHKAYPVLHYYYSKEINESLPVNIVILDEALTVFNFAIPEEHRPNSLLLKEARSSVQSYLDTLEDTTEKKPASAPLPLDLAVLQQAGVPTVSEQQYRKAIAGLEERRTQLSELLKAGARDWPN